MAGDPKEVPPPANPIEAAADKVISATGFPGVVDRETVKRVGDHEERIRRLEGTPPKMSFLDRDIFTGE